MFKEAILYVNEIICLAESTLNNSTNQEDTSINNSKTNNNQEESIEIECTLPDLDMISIIEPLDDSKSKNISYSFR
jgi:hypothetical protein